MSEHLSTSKEPQRRLRLFVIEDQTDYAEALRELVSINPAYGLDWAGHVSKNTPDLPDQVANSRADVVVADAVLLPGLRPHDLHRFPELNGIDACRRIRERLGKSIRIIVFTQYPMLREQAVTQGRADEFLQKGIVGNLLNAITGREVKQEEPGQIRLTLNVGTRQVRVTRGTQSLSEFPLHPTPFALLWYLAEERHRGARDWLRKDASRKSHWAIMNPEVWNQVHVDSYSGHDCTSTTVEGDRLTAWVNKINRYVKGHLKGDLVENSGRGRLAAVPRFYRLFSEIAADQVVIERTNTSV